MGASESSNSAKYAQYLAQYGGIYIKPDKDRFCPGEQFNGYIYLNLLKSYPGDSLYVIVKGVEKYMYSYTSDNDRSTSYNVAKDKSVFVNQKIPVYKVSGRDFQPGQYAFPISFLIPPGTPPSFYQEGNDWVASIEFKVKAVLETFDPKSPKLRYKESILIEDNKNLQGIPNESQRRFELKVCGCCCCCGEATISLGLEKNALIPGETTNLGFFVDNSKGGLVFESVRCELIEKIALGNYRYLFRNNVVELNFPGIEPKANSRRQEVQITLPPYKPQNIKSKRIPYKRYRYDDVHKMRYGKNELVPTTRGKLVDVQYFLAVELINHEWGAGCCFSNPIVEILVQVYLPSFTLNNNIQAPQDWNPKLMSSSNFALDVAPTMNYYEGVDPDSQNQARQLKQDAEILTQKMGMDDNFMKPHKNFDDNFMKPHKNFDDYNFKENPKGADYHKF